MFVCSDGRTMGMGKTLNEAYEDYETNNDGVEDIQTLSWFEGEEIEVDVRITKKEIIQTNIKKAKS